MVSCDYIKVMYIENRTSDAVIIGSSRYCCIDSVIGDKSGFPITEEFLKTMRDYWFDFK